MIIVGAMTRDRVIGSGDGMPWDVPEEYAHFLKLVAGQTIVIGRRSYEIFGEGLTSAHTVVVSRNAGALGAAPPGVVVAPSVGEAVRVAASYGRTVFSAGGASIYAATIPLAERMHLSYIEGAFTGDAYGPAFDAGEWEVERREGHPRFEYVEYRRVRPSA